MLSMLKVLGQYVWEKMAPVGDEVNEEEKLEKELVQLQKDISEEVKPVTSEEKLPLSTVCFNMTGTITKLTTAYGIIDKIYHFVVNSEDYEKYREKDIVQYLAYSTDGQETFKIVKILSVQERSWDRNHKRNKIEEKQQAAVNTVNDQFEIGNRDIIGKVAKRRGRIVILEDSEVQFNLDDVKASFLPMPGDWLQLNCDVQLQDGTTIETTVGEVLRVKSISSLRNRQMEGKINSWDKGRGVGIVNDYILVVKEFCNCTAEPSLGDRVFVDAIESDQKELKWRALSLSILKKRKSSTDDGKVNLTLKPVQNKFNVVLSGDSDFGDLQLAETKSIILTVFNGGQTPRTIKDAGFSYETSESQMKMLDLSKTANIIVGPGESYRITVECYSRFYGVSEELFTVQFENFHISHTFKVNVSNPDWKFERCVKKYLSDVIEGKSSLIKYKQDNTKDWIPGVPTVKPPCFLYKRLPYFHIPKRFWNAIYDGYADSNTSVELYYHLEKTEPCLNMDLTFENYATKFHTLLYLEEVHCIIRLKRYDIQKTYMIASGQYLILNIDGLNERRPSLIVGDSVKVQTSDYAMRYQGYIHQINNTSVYLMFTPDFHSKYKGEDVSVEFTWSRSAFVKFHQGIAMATTLLGKEILFPDRLMLKPFQIDAVDADAQDLPAVTVSPQSYVKKLNSKNINKLTENEEKKVSIIWYNDSLNEPQKAAVLNALKGECRPLPYIIFGPPGTGKTITLVEIILQLVKNLPDARLLIATPSNSAADNLSERLVGFGILSPGTMLRLLAHHIAVKGNISETLKPYCATVDVSKDFSTKKSQDSLNGVRASCPKSVLGRHRVTIGTCSCLSAFIKLGFPQGHFTHVIVDEAGQAIEPEVMVPMSFIDKHTGQIILAGDPMQLGPVVLSQYSIKYGLGESYMERLLEYFPYKKDIESFGADNGGYDYRLIARLTKNYRSIPKVLQLVSDMFYDGNLEACLSPNTGRVAEDVDTLSEFLISRGWSLEKGYPGVAFHGVRGVDYKSEQNPSWFNPQEAAMVLMCTLKLYRLGFTAGDIGIVSPYLQQSIHIRSLFQDVSDECPKTGSVEDFQGQERKIIILTAVRSSISLLDSHLNSVLGFVKNPKRLNVSISRAKVLLLIFGDPHLLALDPLWCTVIKYALRNGGYMGCNLPESLIEF